MERLPVHLLAVSIALALAGCAAGGGSSKKPSTQPSGSAFGASSQWRSADPTVVQRDVITPAQVKSGSEAFRAELLNERRNQFFAAYMGKAKQRMKVEINNEVISRVTSAMRL